MRFPKGASREAQGLEHDGGFTKYAAADVRFLFSVPDAMYFEETALLEPLTCCTHW